MLELRPIRYDSGATVQMRDKEPDASGIIRGATDEGAKAGKTWLDEAEIEAIYAWPDFACEG